MRLASCCDIDALWLELRPFSASVRNSVHGWGRCGLQTVGSRDMPKRVVVGVVKSDKMMKSRRVEIARLVKHAKYGKIVRRRTVCYVHDENNESAMGDLVEIVEARPRSKSKRWDLVRVVEKNRAVDVAAMKAARALVESEQTASQG